MTAKFLPQQFIDLLRVGFALGRFHCLPDQGIEGFFLASLELCDHRRIGSEHLVDQFLDRSRIGNLLEPLFLDNFVGALALTIP